MTRHSTAPQKRWRRTLASNRPSRLTFALLGLVAGFLASFLVVVLVMIIVRVWVEVTIEGFGFDKRQLRSDIVVLGALLTPPLCAVICAIWGYFGGEHMLDRLEALWGSPTCTRPHDP